jgi:tetratricopeptide (TPR) repeat protein
MRTFIAAALIILCALAAYSNSFTDLFLGLDGKQSIRDNPHIRRLWPLSEALSLPTWGSAINPEQHPTVAYRPAFSLVLALTYHFFGLKPRAFHGVNLAIHIAAALVLFGIVRRTLRRRQSAGRGDARSTWLALAAALIWLVHPLQTESVTYVVQLCESLSGLMLLLTLYCAIRSLESEHRHWWQVGAIAACAVSIGSKQPAGVAPLLVLLYDHTFVWASGTKRYRPALYAALTIPVVASLLLVIGGLRQYVRLQEALNYALTQPGVILHYLRLSIWPDELFLYVNTSVFTVHSPVDALLPASVLLALLVGTCWGIAGRRWFGFLGGWFFLTLAPTSSLIPITDQIQEHRMYLPLAAVAVLAVVGGDAVLRAGLKPWLPERARVIFRTGLLAVVLVALGIRTYVRNWDYHHEFTAIHPADLQEDYTILADHYLSKPGLIEAEAGRARATLGSPDHDARDVPFAHFILGLALARAAELPEAAKEFRRVLELEPDFAYAHKELGVVLRELGDLSGAVAHLEQAIRIRPDFVYAYKELAVALKQEGDTAAATDLLERALQLQPGFGEAHVELGVLAVHRHDKAAAIKHFTEALHLQPDIAEVHYELGILWRDQGDLERAVAELEEAVRSKPDLKQARDDLVGAKRELRDRELAAHHVSRALAIDPASASAEEQAAAIESLRKAIQIYPDSINNYLEAAVALKDEGNVGAAEGRLQLVLRVKPDFAEAHYELGLLRRDQGDLGGAVKDFDAAVRLDPDFAQAHYDLALVLREQGDSAGAAEHLRRAVAIDPELVKANDAREH